MNCIKKMLDFGGSYEMIDMIIDIGWSKANEVS